MVRRKHSDILATVVLAVALTLPACEAPAPAPQVQVVEPAPPKELFEATFIYPPQPVILQLEQFRQSLRMLANQLTVLYVVEPEKSPDDKILGCLAGVQRQFYRYGVQVLLIHLGSPAGWDDLRTQLRQNGANFPAAYLPPDYARDLKSFLHFPDLREYTVFIVDDAADTITPAGRRLTCPQFRKLMIDTLTKRAGGTGKRDVSR